MEDPNGIERKCDRVHGIWEFRGRPDRTKEFEAVYGSKGEWAQFFRKSRDYVKIELVRDLKGPACYLTLDVWASQTAYEEFRRQYATEYEEIDRQCSDLTEHETKIGRFESAG